MSQFRIIKVGGSLFHDETLHEKLHRFLNRLNSNSDLRNILICGGGWRADRVRAMTDLTDGEQHWAAIECMSEMTRELRVMTSLPLSTRIEEWNSLKSNDTLFDPQHFLRNVEATMPGTRLPIGWHVTSDSISARLAVVMDAYELRLLKAKMPATSCYSELARQRYVDDFFPSIANEVRSIRFGMLTDK